MKTALITAAVLVSFMAGLAMAEDAADSYGKGNQWLKASEDRFGGSSMQSVASPLIAIAYYLKAIFLQGQEQGISIESIAYDTNKTARILKCNYGCDR